MNADAERWLRFANEDLAAAECLWRTGIHAPTCFHAQPCAEKCLKALMADGGKRPPRVHAIAELLAALDDERLDPLRDTLADLDMFYIPTRYPDALPGTLPDGLPGREEAMSAIYAAREISRLVEEIMRCR